MDKRLKACFIMVVVIFISPRLMDGKTHNETFDNFNSLTKFHDLLSISRDTDFLILMDVGNKSKSFLDILKNISKGAIKCLHHLGDLNNKVAIMTFAGKPRLQVNFCQHCFKKKNFLAKTDKNIQTLNEYRSVTRGLKKALRLLQRRSSDGRKQTVLLITFGMDQTLQYKSMNIPDRLKLVKKLSDKFTQNNITLAVAGVGEEALSQKKELKVLVENQPDKYFTVVDRDDILDALEILIGFVCVGQEGQA